MHSDYSNITETFCDFYIPRKALLMYEHAQDANKIFMESYDCTESGKLINAHPLSVKEIERLSEVLQYSSRDKDKFLFCDGLLPESLLHVNPKRKCAIWFSPPQQAHLLFSKNLGLPDGTLLLPALIWKATSEELFVFAIKEETKPTAKTTLFHAPVFNTYEDGKICMGTVETDLKNCKNVTEFMQQWQQYFFNSHFSHTLGTHGTAQTPIEILYGGLLNTALPFPKNELAPTGKTIQTILP